MTRSIKRNIAVGGVMAILILLVIPFSFVAYIGYQEDEIANCTLELGYSLKEEVDLFIDIELGEKKYADVVRDAIRGDTTAIKLLSLAHFGDGKMRVNSTIVVGIIYRLGEYRYLKIISDFTPAQRVWLCEIIDTGLEFSGKKDFRESLPALYAALKEYNY